MIKAGTEASRRCSLSSLLIIGGREVLMHKVDECIETLHRTTLPEFLNKEDTRQKISKLLKRNIISQEQYDDVLYPCTGTVSSGQLEIALLVVLWRTCFSSVPYDDQLWYKGVELALNDDSIEADIVRLRDFKNELQSTPIHSEDAFENKWSCISRVLLRMGKGLQSLGTTLDTLKEQQHRSDEYERIQADLQRWTDMDQEYECGLDFTHSESKSRRYRLFSLITDGCSSVLRNVFSNKNLKSSDRRLQTGQTKLSLEKSFKKSLNRTQYNLLYSQKSSPQSEDVNISSSYDFDISILIILLRHMCGYVINSHDQYEKKDETAEADIARLRQHRNKIAHIPRTGGLSEREFEATWTDISQILLRLNGACEQPLLNLQSEIDNLKKQTVDPKGEKDREDDVDTIIDTIKKHSVSEAAKAHWKETVKDVLSNDYFVRTKQFTEAMDRLKKNNIIVLNGAPGEGKTTIANKLLLEVVSSDSCMHLNTYADWVKVSLDTVNGVLIDDMFGSGVFDKEECRKWQKHIPSIEAAAKSKDLYVIITSRSYILADALEKMIVESTFVEENIVTLSSKYLTEGEKRRILNTHFSKASHKIGTKRKHEQLVENSVKLVLDSPVSSSTIGFPECARLCSGNATLYKEDVEFFKRPMTAVKTCFSNLFNDDDTFVAFFVLWAQTSKSLTSIDLECPVHNTPDKIINPIKSLQYRPIDHIRQIRGVLQIHIGGFIQFDSESEIFSFSHRVVQDAVGLVSYKKNTTAVMQYCDPSFIENYISIDKSEQSRIEKHRDDKLYTSVTETSSHDIITEAEAISDGSGSEVSEHGSNRPKASTLLGSENQLNVLSGSRSESSEHESSVPTKQLDPNKDELSEHSRNVPDIDEHKEASGGGGKDNSSSTDESNDDTILGETSVLGRDTPMNMIQLNHARYKQLSVRIGTLVTSDLQPHDSHKNLDVSLLKLKHFENEDFCGKFFDAMREKDMLKQILQTPIRTLESEFAEFKFFKNVNSEVRLPSYMLWAKERLCPLIEKGFDAMDADLLKHELNIAMLIATKLGNSTLVSCLLEKGAAIDINMIAIALAKQNNEMFDFLMNKRKGLAKTVLHEVCEAGYPEIASLLLQKGFSTTERDEYGHCPVHVAAIRGHVDTVCALLKLDSSQAYIPYTSVNPNQSAMKEATLFHIAAYMGHNAIVDFLINRGIHANVRDANGRTPFMLAIYAKRNRIVSQLLQLAVEDRVQSTPDKENNTPLLIAIKNITLGRQYLPIAMELCKYKQNIHLENSEGDIALLVACKCGFDSIASAILDQDNPFKREGDNTVLDKFIIPKDLNSIKTLLRCIVDIDYISVEHYKILIRLEEELERNRSEHVSYSRRSRHSTRIVQSR